MVITLTSWDTYIYIYDMYDIAPVILAIYIYIFNKIKSNCTHPKYDLCRPSIHTPKKR